MACNSPSAAIARIERAICDVLPEANWQRCYVHFLRYALDSAASRAGTIRPESTNTLVRISAS
jgi:transposase-like protein